MTSEQLKRFVIVEPEAKMNEVYAKWNALCKEFEEARAAQWKAFGTVNRKFTAVAQNKGGNPTDEELEQFEKTRDRLEDVLRRIHEFVKANT